MKIEVSELDFNILQEIASVKQKNVEQTLKEIIREKMTERPAETETEEEKTKTETVTVNLTVKVPKKYYDFLEGFGRLNGMKPEDFITAEAYANLRDFFSSGDAEAWFEQMTEKNGDELEKLARKVEDEVYAATS